MAFRKKAPVILKYEPDILVVQECEHPEKLKFADGVQLPKQILWYGENLNKGLGIFSYSDYRFKLIRTYNPLFKTIVPIAVTGGAFEFNIFAIWANNPGDPDGPYVTQTWKAIQHYDNILKKKPSILIGDFNSNTIWDRPRRKGNHTTIVEMLEKKKITSVYHKHHNQIQGKEEHPTLFLYKHENKPYHLDYCFGSDHFTNRLKSVEVGIHKDWMPYSDHVPVIVDFA